MLLLLSMTCGPVRTDAGILSVCIQNCGQCEKMYGDFFHGQECAEQCLQTLGVPTPDCSNLASIRRFLGPSAKLVSARSRVEQQIPRFLVKTRVEKDTHGIEGGCQL